MADEKTGYVVLVVPQGGFQEIGRAPEARDHDTAIDEVLPENAEGQFVAFPVRTYETAMGKAVKVTVEQRPVRSVERLVGGPVEADAGKDDASS